jgi:pyridoxamine 5'-phosphate oxidase
MTDLQQLVDRFNDALVRAAEAGVVEPTAASLATVAADGGPSVRMVLLKHADARGFVFYTNLVSRKGRELAGNPRASLCFWWGVLAEQVRVEGSVEAVTVEEADAYFATRPRASQISAWASRQGELLASRKELLDRFAALEAKFRDGEVPRPPHWSGFRLVPDRIEFWYGRPDRLHERFEYHPGRDGWVEQILSP